MRTSPFGPPFEPAFPSPRSEIVCPSSIPAGTLTESLFETRSFPEPLQLLHGLFIIFPVPPQVGHTLELETTPSGVRRVVFIAPVPWHAEQVSALVPASAPEPPHFEHLSVFVMLISFVQPNAASSNVRMRFTRRLSPRVGAFLLDAPPPPNPPPPNPPPKNEPKMSPMSKSSKPNPPPP